MVVLVRVTFVMVMSVGMMVMFRDGDTSDGDVSESNASGW